MAGCRSRPPVGMQNRSEAPTQTQTFVAITLLRFITVALLPPPPCAPPPSCRAVEVEVEVEVAVEVTVEVEVAVEVEVTVEVEVEVEVTGSGSSRIVSGLFMADGVLHTAACCKKKNPSQASTLSLPPSIESHKGSANQRCGLRGGAGPSDHLATNLEINNEV